MSDEEKLDGGPRLEPIEHGFDKDGYLRIKIHLSAGKWNILGALAEAQVLVTGYFNQMNQVNQERKERLVRPGSAVERFNKWGH